MSFIPSSPVPLLTNPVRVGLIALLAGLPNAGDRAYRRTPTMTDRTTTPPLPTTTQQRQVPSSVTAADLHGRPGALEVPWLRSCAGQARRARPHELHERHGARSHKRTRSHRRGVPSTRTLGRGEPRRYGILGNLFYFLLSLVPSAHILSPACSLRGTTTSPMSSCLWYIRQSQSVTPTLLSRHFF